jgi:glycosyltransferase involved in cell wall biosynthesis
MSSEKLNQGQPVVAVILPALNEEEAVGKVISEVPKKALEENGFSVKVIVDDNDSIDRTKLVAEENTATVIKEPRRGKGYAVNTGIRSTDADYFFLMDADHTYPPSHIPEMLKLLEHKHVVIGSRVKGHREKGSIKLLNLMGVVFLSLAATIIYQRRISDICTGYWGLRGEVAKKLNLNAMGFDIEARLFSEITRKKFSTVELPINYRRRMGGEPKLRPFRDGFRILRVLLVDRFKTSYGNE